MVLEKIRAFFVWLGKRSAAKSQKALDYEWTTMSKPGDVPVKTVDIGEDEPAAAPAPAAAAPACAPEVKAAAEPAPEPALERRMTALLKKITIRDALAALQDKFPEAADVRRSRVGLIAFLREKPEALDALEAKTQETKPARKPAAKKPATKKPAARKPAARKAAEKPAAEEQAAEAAPAAKAAPKPRTRKAPAAAGTKPKAVKAPAKPRAKPAAKKTAADKPAAEQPAAAPVETETK